MHTFLYELPELINRISEIVDLLLYRLTILGLAALAARGSSRFFLRNM
jgi:hypothetical protein